MQVMTWAMFAQDDISPLSGQPGGDWNILENKPCVHERLKGGSLTGMLGVTVLHRLICVNPTGCLAGVWGGQPTNS